MPVGNNASSCQNVKQCSDGYGEVQPPTPTSDRVCAACQFGITYSSSGKCVAQPNCTVNQYESEPPTTTSARSVRHTSFQSKIGMSLESCSPILSSHHLSPQCLTLTSCGNLTFESVPPAPNRDRTCSPCTVCPAGQEETPCSPTSDAVCKNCPTCQDGKYASGACTASSERQCLLCQKCSDKEFESVPCTPFTNRNCILTRVCTPPANYMIVDATPTSDRVCKGVTKCGNDEYKAVEATYTSDADCKPVRPLCADGQQESAPPTATSDRACAPCPAGTSGVNGTCIPCQPGQDASSEGSAGPCSSRLCPPGTIDDDSNPATPCVPCPDNQFQPQSGQTSCMPQRDCPAGTMPASNPSPAQERVYVGDFWGRCDNGTKKAGGFVE